MAPGTSSATPSADRGGLREIAYKPGYDSGDQALHQFYVPTLQRAVSYDRSVGYFRSSSLSVAAKGVARFVAGGGRMRLLAGAQLTDADAHALQGEAGIPQELAERLAAALVTDDEIASERLAVLAWLVREKRLDVRIVVAVDREGRPAPGGTEDAGYFHEKIGVLRDARGDGVAFQGSVNESATAWARNFESFSVYRSWDGTAELYDHWARRFEDRWNGHVPGFRVYELPDAVRDALIDYAPTEPPIDRDPEERPAPADPALLAKFLQVAPRLPDTDALADATVGVTPFPHQRQVVERLAGTYPRSWLLADEVGLGKTISAGLALRRLILSNRIKRALVLAPANVAKQWQDELFEKFGLWVPRMESGRFYGAHPDDVQPVPPGENPYSVHPLLIVSSHLARLPEHRQLIADTAPFDLLIIDEAHHARRRGFQDLTEYRPSLLLRLLDELRTAGKLNALWLLTATPMQVHPVELRDLLIQVGLTGPLATWSTFERFYRELARGDEADWRWLARTLSDAKLPDPGPAEAAVLERIDRKLGVVVRDRIARFAQAPTQADTVAEQLGPDGRAELREWLRLRSPVGQFVTRHSRETLKRYRDQGLLDEPVADRDVGDQPIDFNSEERRLYGELDQLLDRLTATHGTRRNAGFVLTIYRRRLTSSWEAISRTLARRVARQSAFSGEPDLWDLAGEELEDETGRAVDDTEAVPLTEDDIAEIGDYLEAIRRLNDSKLDQLRRDLDRARASGQSAIVFTQFTDTLDYLRDRLVHAYRDHLATYSGAGGRMYDVEQEQWYEVSKQELVAAIRSGRCSVVLATDAASEGLNLQACSFLINYDLPWNPMRVEQRIGRIDRIGQAQPVITVVNYTIPGTIEVDVYAALRTRIGQFHNLVGRLQPVLGATERAIQAGYRARRQDRDAVIGQEVTELLKQVDELDATGIDLHDEDPLPLPEYPPPPITLVELQRCVVEDLDLRLAVPGRSVTFDAAKTSRDSTDWAALVTYGHPRLATELERISHTYDADRGPVVFAEAGDVVEALRGDRSPPESVRTVENLEGLGQPYARGEAEQAARRRAESISAERRAKYLGTLAWRGDDWQVTIRSRFRRLATEAVAAQCALVEQLSSDDADPPEQWAALGQRQDGWRYAEAFRVRLGMALDDLLPARPDVNARRLYPRADLEEQLRAGAVELAGMMDEWKTPMGRR